MSATIYRQAVEAGGARVQESSARIAATGELEIQARWFAGESGRSWTTSTGAPAFIEDFGRWNHEAGPDFIDARVRIGSREYRGAIEIDLDARDWERHGHATNPAFRETVVHLFVHQPDQRFFTRTSDHREVAQVLLTPPPAPRKSATSSAAPKPITTDPHGSTVPNASSWRPPAIDSIAKLPPCATPPRSMARRTRGFPRLPSPSVTNGIKPPFYSSLNA